jgi:hypothetical protein
MRWFAGLVFIVMIAVIMGKTAAGAEMNDADRIVLETERPLLFEALTLCSSADINSVTAAIPAFSQKLQAAGVLPDPFDDALASRGMVNFSAWGFREEDVPDPLKERSFFVTIRVQGSSGRMISFCQVTDMTTNAGATALSLVEADWLETLRPWLSGAAAYETGSPETPADDATFHRYFDISTADVLQSVSIFRVGHKVEVTMIRSSMR